VGREVDVALDDERVNFMLDNIPYVNGHVYAAAWDRSAGPSPYPFRQVVRAPREAAPVARRRRPRRCAHRSTGGPGLGSQRVRSLAIRPATTR
jgi:hypothetical protein